MTFTLYVDGRRWRAHTDQVLAGTPGLVPVIKGNGYGYGADLLAAEASRLGVQTVAVGEPHEVAAVRAAFAGDIAVLRAHLPGVDGVPEPDDRVIRTAATLDGLRALAGHRVVVELLTSMQRFGLEEPELAQVGGLLADARLEGFALHLPMVGSGRPAEVEAALNLLERRGLTRVAAAGPSPATIWVSHLTEAELAALTARHPDVSLRARVGTRLWLGDRAAAQAKGTVLAVHRLARGQRYGYRQHKAPRAGHLIVVGGGTAHGVALSAPSPAGSIGQRAKIVATGGLEALGRSLSPFHVQGAQRWFAEPPHMQVSMIWLPDGVAVPAVGAELDTDVRMTTASFDRVVLD